MLLSDVLPDKIVTSEGSSTVLILPNEKSKSLFDVYILSDNYKQQLFSLVPLTLTKDSRRVLIMIFENMNKSNILCFKGGREINVLETLKALRDYED